MHRRRSILRSDIGCRKNLLHQLNVDCRRQFGCHGWDSSSLTVAEPRRGGFYNGDGRPGVLVVGPSRFESVGSGKIRNAQ